MCGISFSGFSLYKKFSFFETHDIDGNIIFFKFINVRISTWKIHSFQIIFFYFLSGCFIFGFIFKSSRIATHHKKHFWSSFFGLINAFLFFKKLGSGIQDDPFKSLMPLIFRIIFNPSSNTH